MTARRMKQSDLLLFLLIGAVLATLYVHANGEQSLVERLAWWLMITLGMVFLGWAMGLVTAAP